MDIIKLAKLNEKMFNHIYRGEYEKVKECLDNGADVNAKERFGNSTLISALGCGHTKIAKLLIERGVDINAENDKGITALDLAKDSNLPEFPIIAKPELSAKALNGEANCNIIPQGKNPKIKPKSKSNDFGMNM